MDAAKNMNVLYWQAWLLSIMDVIILAGMDAVDHGCTRDMNVIIMASMDVVGHGCTRDQNITILASLDALDHGRARNMNVMILASTESLAKKPLHSILGQHGRSRSWMHWIHGCYFNLSSMDDMDARAMTAMILAGMDALIMDALGP